MGIKVEMEIWRQRGGRGEFRHVNGDKEASEEGNGHQQDMHMENNIKMQTEMSKEKRWEKKRDESR